MANQPMVSLSSRFKSLAKWFSDENLTKRATLNALAVGLDYAVRLLIGFVLAPLLVTGLGDFFFGAWQVLSRLGGYVSAASGRPTQALKWAVANQQASTDSEAKRRLVGSTVVTWLLFLPLLTVFGGVLVWLAPSLVHASAQDTRSVRIAAGLLAGALIAVILAEVPRSVLQGENLGYRRMGLSTVLVLVGGGLTALALFLGSGIVGVAGANLVNTILPGVVFLYLVRSYVPWFGIAKPSSGEIRQFLGLSWWFLVWRLVNQLMMTSDVVVLGILMSAELVTTYSLVKAVPETLVSVVAIVVGGITPGLGGIIGSGDLQKASRVRAEIMSLTWLIVTAAGTTTIIWNQPFVRLWVGQEYQVGPIPSLLIMLMVVQLVLIRNDAFFIDLTLDLRQKVLLGALSTGLSLALAGIFIGVANLGIVGLCLGFIAGRSILSVGYPRMISRFLGVPLSSQLTGLLRPAFTTIVLLLCATGLSTVAVASTWFVLVPATGVTAIVVLLISFFAGLPGEQRNRVLVRVRLVLRHPGTG